MNFCRHLPHSKQQHGFTLIELLVVLTILGLLAAVATPQVMKHLGHAKTQTAKMEIINIATALDLFRVDVGRYPTQKEGLAILSQKPNNIPQWNGPYIEKKDGLNDPWGTAYVYVIPGKHGEYDLYTLGADQVEGGTGENEDVTNW